MSADPHPSPRSRALLLLFVLAASVSLVLPWFPPANRVRPLMLGLPMALFWVLAWALATCVALALYHRATHGGRDDQPASAARDGDDDR